MLAIYKKELRSYFTGLMGYIFIAFVLLILGIYTMIYNFMSMQPRIEYVLAAAEFMFLIAIPILTMRIISEEKRQRTDQLLYSAPVKLSSLVVGKYLALVTVFMVPMAVIALYPLIFSMYGTVHFLGSYSSLLAFILLGMALIAVGVFMSALTENQIIAAVISFAAILLIYWIEDLGSVISASPMSALIFFVALAVVIALIVRAMTKNTSLALIVGLICAIVLVVLYLALPDTLLKGFAAAFGAISVFGRFETFINGVFDLGAIVYDLSVIVLMLFFSSQVLEKKRWS